MIMDKRIRKRRCVRRLAMIATAIFLSFGTLTLPSQALWGKKDVGPSDDSDTAMDKVSDWIATRWMTKEKASFVRAERQSNRIAIRTRKELEHQRRLMGR